MSTLQPALDYASSHRDESLAALKELLQIPSISTLPEYESDMRSAAEWVADRLASLGFEKVQIMPTERHPIVFGEKMDAGKNAPTILVYGHYDVQPTDPLELWETDPFQPTIRGDNLFARGSSDMKGQVVAHLMAVEAITATGEMPVNVKYMIEGEEEVGSPSMEGYIADHATLLAADLCLNADSAILGPEIPAITYGLRGLAYFELRLRGSSHDLHSGSFGGVVDNPAQVLAYLIAGMKDRQGKILLPGFYDDVRVLTPEERQALGQLPQTGDWWREQADTEHLFVEEGFTATESGTARPTLDVNGILSGFTGEGSKTIIPASAMAKISTRLVPDQRPEQVKAGLIEYLRDHVPPTMDWELLDHAKCPAAIIPIDSKAVRAARPAFQAVWGREPLFTRMGGSVPVVGELQSQLSIETLMMGFGLPDDNLHAPNEKLYLPNFFRGIRTYIQFMYEFAK